MKKVLKIILFICVCSLLSWGVWTYISYSQRAVKLDIDVSGVFKIGIIGCVEYETKDKSKIQKIGDFLSSTTFYKDDSIESLCNTTPDVFIFMYDINGVVVNTMEFSGDIARYHKSFYRIYPFTFLIKGYSDLEGVCNKLGTD